jgi:hypothetical protein
MAIIINNTANKEIVANYAERRQWFIDRIGKTLYRKKTTCDCESCKKVCVNGIEVLDKDHANYLHDVECNDMGIIYYDNKNLK